MFLALPNLEQMCLALLNLEQMCLALLNLAQICPLLEVNLKKISGGGQTNFFKYFTPLTEILNTHLLRPK